MAQQGIGAEITVEQVQLIAFKLAQKHLAFDEPIPDFKTRFPNILESCVNLPFQKVYGKQLYPKLIDKAAILFYLMIKNHPFQNGNKRIAITTVLMFLSRHNKWLRAEMRDLYNFTIWVARSKAEDKDFVILAAKQFFAKHLVKFDE